MGYNPIHNLTFSVHIFYLHRSTRLTDDEVHEKDDPHDDITDSLGNLPKENTDSTERPDKRDTRRTKQSDVQRKESPVAERGKA